MRHSNRIKTLIDSFIVRYRHLPHWESPNSIYFVTSRCLPYIRLDQSQKSIVLETIKFLNGRKYELYAAVVMDDHFHLIFKPLEPEKGKAFSLSSIMHSIKSYSAHRIGEKIWMDEYYDRIIRNSNELKRKLHYLIMNPVKAGYVSDPFQYEWLYIAGDKSL